MNYPFGIIFVNANISEQVLQTTKNQLLIHQTISLDDFNSNKDYYINLSKTSRERILVLIDDFYNILNREFADVVIYISSGLAYILKNNFGPPGLTIQVDKLYIQKLLINVDKLEKLY